jgi:uncharacterized protein YndB with AHSA1/START domain
VNATTDTTLRLTRQIQASPERVFQAWTRATELERWSCPEGCRAVDVQVDLRIGGAYLIDMADPDGGRYTAFGEYREIDPPRRLVYTWDWKQEELRMGETLVTVEFAAKDGGTEVVLTHAKLPDLEARKSHEEGWSDCLDHLERLFA